MNEKTKNMSIGKFVLYITFTAILGWWLALHYVLEPSDQALEIFSGSYGVIALIGGILALGVSRKWGGSKSVIGKAILLYAFGLFAQEFGQISYSLYTFAFNKEIPYPSIGDIGYMGSVFLYIWATLTLVKAVAAKHVVKSYLGKVQVILVPLGVLIFSYIEFLRGYDFSSTGNLTMLLDFGYPLGQAFYVSLALLAFTLSRKYLGGVMRSAVVLLICALILQYFADFMFLYQTNKDTWTTAGVNDLLYAVSYFVMSMSLLRFGSALNKLSTNDNSGGNS